MTKMVPASRSLERGFGIWLKKKSILRSNKYTEARYHPIIKTTSLEGIFSRREEKKADVKDR
ncbi:MAG: hypothetical protein QXI84_10155 [Thermofilaceae archaeon]